MYQNTPLKPPVWIRGTLDKGTTKLNSTPVRTVRRMSNSRASTRSATILHAETHIHHPFVLMRVTRKSNKNNKKSCNIESVIVGTSRFKKLYPGSVGPTFLRNAPGEKTKMLRTIYIVNFL